MDETKKSEDDDNVRIAKNTKSIPGFWLGKSTLERKCESTTIGHRRAISQNSLVITCVHRSLVTAFRTISICKLSNVVCITVYVFFSILLLLF